MTSKSNPLVSIIIPVFNGGDYLREAIESALAQTYENIEIIIVNDGSTDGGITEAIIQSYGDKIISVEKENGGVASALNEGIRLMKGEYFSWLSHDDRYEPSKVEKQIQFLNKLKDPLAICYSDFVSIDQTGKSICLNILGEIPPKKMLWRLLTDNGIHGCSLLIPHIAFQKVGLFDETLFHTQDFDMWLRLADICKFYYIPECLVHGRQHENQGCRQNGHLEAVSCFYEQMACKITDEYMRKAFLPKEYPSAYLSLINQCAIFGQKAIAIQFFKSGFKMIRYQDKPLFLLKGLKLLKSFKKYNFEENAIESQQNRNSQRDRYCLNFN